MKKCLGVALALCLLLTACGGETVQTPEQGETTVPEEEAQTPETPAEPEKPETPKEPEYADWQVAYAAFLEELAGRVKTLRNTDRPDYDPNSVDLEIGEASGTYVLYDIDKDGVPELMLQYGLGEAGYHTTFYGYRDGAVTEIGDIPTGHTSLYTWPGENAMAYNWGHMGGHFVDQISIVDGGLEETKFFEESTFDTLRALQLCDKDGARGRSDLRIPTLGEYISICKKYGKVSVLELKNSFEQADIDAIVEIIRELDYLTSVIFISFDYDNLLKLRRTCPGQPAQFLTYRVEDWDALIARLAADRLDLDVYYGLLDKELVEKLHAAGIVINVWTCDDPAAAGQLAQWGVDQITTNILE